MLIIPDYSEIDPFLRSDLISRLQDVKSRIRSNKSTLAISIIDEIIDECLAGIDDDLTC